MGFLKRLFGREEDEKSPTGYHDPQGIYLYVKCDNCGTCVKLRADKQHDLENTGNGYTWHKTIVDSKCFRRMQTVVQFNRDYEVINTQLDGGEYITEEDYQNWLDAQEAAKAMATNELQENEPVANAEVGEEQSTMNIEIPEATDEEPE